MTDILIDPKGGKNRRGQSYAEVILEHLIGMGLPAALSPLEYGDVAFIGNGPDGPVSIGIELKTITDLLTAMMNGRLATHQIPGMCKTYDRAWLIVDGVSRVNRKTGHLELPRGVRWVPVGHGRRPIRYSDVEAFLTKLEFQAGISVRRTRSQYETASTVAAIYKYCSRQYDEHSKLERVGPPIGDRLDYREARDPKRRLIRDWAACLPSVGYGRASQISEAFRTPAELAGADVERWRIALWLGPKATLPRKIHEAIHGENTKRAGKE